MAGLIGTVAVLAVLLVIAIAVHGAAVAACARPAREENGPAGDQPAGLAVHYREEASDGEHGT